MDREITALAIGVTFDGGVVLIKGQAIVFNTHTHYEHKLYRSTIRFKES